MPERCGDGTIMIFGFQSRWSILLTFQYLMNLRAGTNDDWRIDRAQQRRSLKTPTVSVPQRWGRFYSSCFSCGFSCKTAFNSEL